jgi:hypothetical protein
LSEQDYHDIANSSWSQSHSRVSQKKPDFCYKSKKMVSQQTQELLHVGSVRTTASPPTKSSPILVEAHSPDPTP